ncbi:hypothetical protein ABVT39_025790 [Epinephelus coioides]
MSLQVCGCCGWSKVTTYQGLRIHQGKMGCTPKGMHIPESQQYGFNSYTRNLTYNGPPIKFQEPLWNPERSSTTYQTATNARRALDFTSNVQVGQLAWDVPTTTAQETAVRPKEREEEEEREREKEREKEREREAQKLQKARQDKIKADLQQKIQTREQKLAEVTSSVKACKGDLDAEWLEINSVFSEVMRVVEVARQKALQPLEERRQRVKREAQDVVKKLQKEIDKLKNAIDELDQNQDSQVSPGTGPNEPRDWKNVTVDTSFTFGSLRTTTSNMINLIQQKIEKLSSVDKMKVALLFALVFTLSVVHGCIRPCQQKVDGNAYNRFAGKHFVQGCFNRRSRCAWGRYLRKSGLCRRGKLTFIESRDQARVRQICNGYGHRVSNGNDLCTSSSRFVVYQLRVNCKCRVKSVKKRLRFLVVACDLVGRCCLPTRFARATCIKPNSWAQRCR